MRMRGWMSMGRMYPVYCARGADPNAAERKLAGIFGAVLAATSWRGRGMNPWQHWIPL